MKVDDVLGFPFLLNLLMVISVTNAFSVLGSIRGLCGVRENTVQREEDSHKGFMKRINSSALSLQKLLSYVPGLRYLITASQVVFNAIVAICRKPSLLLGNIGNVLAWPYSKEHFTEYEVQSPTDINTSRAFPMLLPAICFHRYSHLAQDSVEVENTGYYLEMFLLPEIKEKPYITGGPLFGDCYELEQGHFHWGHDDHCGSEHHIDGKCFSVEFHWVFYKREYGSFKEAKAFADGVCVIAAFGDLAEEDNQELNHLVDMLADVVEPHSHTRGSFKEDFKFIDVLFKQKDYISFPGSLTTPEYEECVTWIMYTQPFPISSRQIDAFRQLRREDGTGMIRENDRERYPFGIRPLIYPLINKHLEIETEDDSVENDSSESIAGNVKKRPANNMSNSSTSD